MAFTIEFEPDADRDLGKLAKANRRMAERVRDRIRSLADDPRPPGVKQLRGGRVFRLRVGDDRVLYRIEAARIVVIVLRVRHRRDVYEDLWPSPHDSEYGWGALNPAGVGHQRRVGHPRL